MASSSQTCCLVAGYKDLQGPFLPSEPCPGSCPAWTPQKKKGLSYYDEERRQLTHTHKGFAEEEDEDSELLMETETELENARDKEVLTSWSGRVGSGRACCSGSSF